MHTSLVLIRAKRESSEDDPLAFGALMRSFNNNYVTSENAECNNNYLRAHARIVADMFFLRPFTKRETTLAVPCESCHHSCPRDAMINESNALICNELQGRWEMGVVDRLDTRTGITAMFNEVYLHIVRDLLWPKEVVHTEKEDDYRACCQ